MDLHGSSAEPEGTSSPVRQRSNSHNDAHTETLTKSSGADQVHGEASSSD